MAAHAAPKRLTLEAGPPEWPAAFLAVSLSPAPRTPGAPNLSPRTVANYHSEIKSKLGVRSDIELVYLCMRQGLVASLAEPDGI